MIEYEIKCLWKQYAEYKEIEIGQPIPMEDMYNCVTCKGDLKGACPNYIDNKGLDYIIGDYR